MTTDEHADLHAADAPPDGRRPAWLIVLAAVIVIGVIAVVAIVAGGDDGGGDAGDEAIASADQVESGQDGDARGEPVEAPASAGETRPIVFTGDPLPPLEDGIDPALGLAAPVIDGEGFDGSPVAIGGSTTSPTMVVYVAHWCPHCNDEVPELIALSEAGALPDDLNVVAVSTAVREGEANYPPSQWLVDFGWPWPVMADDPDATAFLVSGGTSFPYTVMLDTDGTVLGRASGSRSADEITAWVDATLG